MSELSEEAIRLLQFAIDADDETIMLVDHLSGTTLQIGGQNLMDGLDRRESAQLRSAVQELQHERLIEDRSGKGEVFFLTGPAYDVVKKSSSMTNPSTSPEAPLLERIDDHIEHGEKLLRSSMAAPVVGMIWTRKAAKLITQLYGGASEALRRFPPALEAGVQVDIPNEIKIRLQRLRTLRDAVAAAGVPAAPRQGPIFIGHGNSPVWRELKDFLQDRLRYDWVEFNSEATAGVATTERLQQMLEVSAFALLVMTGEDEHQDKSMRARPNVIHETGLFQGRLGFRRAIVLLEHGCADFSNIHGLTHIGFPRGDIAAAFEKIRLVFEREQAALLPFRPASTPP